MATVVNPANDYIKITAEYFKDNKRENFILPEGISTEYRKDYPMKILRDELTDKYKQI